MISSGALTDPGGRAEGTADGCPGLSGGAGIPPSWPLLAHPAGQPFQAGVSGLARARVADGQAAWALA